MIEEKRVTSARSPVRKVVSSRSSFQKLGTLSLISLLVIVASSLCGAAQARTSRILNTDQVALEEMREKYEQEFSRLTNEENQGPIVGQSDTYEGFYVPEEPFSATERYLMLNSFFVGMKLADTYGENTDLCINDVIAAVDARAYFSNNMTLHERDMEEGVYTTLFLPYLNFTGAIFGPVAGALPSCYDFTYEVYKYENNRFMTFNNNWGNFFLAFLFNQMGNALNFQTKFIRIKEEKDRQNYPGVYQEYGDLVYLILTFQPIEEASLMGGIDSFVERWLEDHAYLGHDEISETHKTIVKTSVSTISRFIHSAGEAFGASFAAIQGGLVAKMQANREASAQKQIIKQESLLLQQSRLLADSFEFEAPVVKAGVADGGDFINGVFTGIVEVFPYDSNQVRCQSNFTQARAASQRMFFDEDLKWDFGDTTFQKRFVTDVAYLLQIPFGLSHSCYWGFSTVLINVDPMEDGVLSEDEELEQRIMISNEYITNVFFNLGYMYQAINSILELLNQSGTIATGTAVAVSDQVPLDYTNLGVYTGDILIRFVWRRRFTRNFEYGGSVFE